MPNVRGVTEQGTIVYARREHRSRLRELEANPAGTPPFGPWSNIVGGVGFQNGFGDSNEAFALDPPAGYARSNDGNWIALRGRLVQTTPSFADGLVAFTLPVGYRPPYRISCVVKAGTPADVGFVHTGVTFWKAANGQGHVIINANGDVIPYMSTTGYGSGASYNFDPFTFGAPDVTLNPLDWSAPIGYPPNVYSYQGGGSVGITSTVSQSPEAGVMYLGSGEYADCEISLTNIAATRIKLGIHCDPWQSTLVGGVDQPGVWMRMSSVPFFAGVDTYYANPILGPAHAQVTTASPGFGPGDIITLKVVGDHLSWLKNGIVINERDGIPMGSGLFGMGVQGASGIPLASDFTGGLPQGYDVSLDGIYFNVNP